MGRGVSAAAGGGLIRARGVGVVVMAVFTNTVWNSAGRGDWGSSGGLRRWGCEVCKRM